MLGLVSLGTIALALLAAPSLADARRNCRKGKPCGNSCIARDKICRIESAGAVVRTRESWAAAFQPVRRARR